MNTQERIFFMAKLGKYLLNNSEELQLAKQNAMYENAWFTGEFIDNALKNIAVNFLNEQLLINWIKAYNISKSKLPKTVGIIMAGNIPLVGFHDLLCVFISGNKALIKPSSKDSVLIKHFVSKLCEWNSEIKTLISFADNLKGCDAYIATGSNNSGRYFEYYFGKFPNIIRRNKTSVAIIEGNETNEELNFLADDIQQYFGLGCRNITKLFVPENYDFTSLLNALKKYDYFFAFHKYKNNYDYQLALLLLNNRKYMSTGALLITENENLFSPIAQLHFEYYNNKEQLIKNLKLNENIQAIIAKNFIPFGKAQCPQLNDYADAVDTMQFLTQL